MAAIKPHLARDGENTEEQREYWRCTSEGLAGLGADKVCPTPQEIANEAHAGLLNTAWVRKALVLQIQGRTIWIAYGKNDEPVIAISHPPRGPAWSPLGGAKKTTILGWTTKMGAPSFSLPAGAPAMGGACPGATAGQTTSSPESRESQAKKLVPLLNKYQGGRELFKVERVNVAQTICEFCYAEGGKYSTSVVQNAQLMRFAWARRAVKRPGHMPGVSEFYSVMLDAIDAADFKLYKEPKQYLGKRFFRLHDSGDFFHAAYLAQWKKITLYYHPYFGGEKLRFADSADDEVVIEQPGDGHPNPIYFWAPTRIWAEGKHRIQLVNRVNGISVKGKPTWDNFQIRPSAYHINQHGPFIDLDGWAAPTTVFDKETKETAEGQDFDWDCRAYAVKFGPSCRGADSDSEGPGGGEEGCRECWLQYNKAVNYTLHL
ncbi:MAG: hypothetical protein ACE5F6_00040 [Anaerolineae bacterium]